MAMITPLRSAGTGTAAAVHGVSLSVVQPPVDVVHEPTAAAAASSPAPRQSPKAWEPDSIGGATVRCPAAACGAIGVSYSLARHDGSGAGVAADCPWSRNASDMRQSVKCPTIVAGAVSLP